MDAGKKFSTSRTAQDAPPHQGRQEAGQDPATGAGETRSRVAQKRAGSVVAEGRPTSALSGKATFGGERDSPPILSLFI